MGEVVPMPKPEVSKWVNLSDLSGRYRCSPRTIWRWVSEQGFPKPRLKTRKSLWAWEDVISWESSKSVA